MSFNSYQNVVIEGLSILAKDGDETKADLSELFRDLYKKVYELTNELNKQKGRIDALDPETDTTVASSK